MEDQILYADSTEEVASEENPHKKLVKKEQRLLERLQEEQEAEAEAKDRFQRAEARLQRKRKRVERIQRKLTLLREELAKLQITEQHISYREPEVILVPLPEEVLQVASEEDAPTQPEQQNMDVQESTNHSQAYTEYPAPDTSGEVQEYTSTHIDVSDIPVNDGDEVMANEEEVSLPQEEITSPTHFTYVPIEPEFEAAPEERSDEEHFAQEEINSPAPLTSEPSESSLESEEAISYEVDTDTSNTIMPEHETAEVVEISAPSSIDESIVASDIEHEPEMVSGSNEVEDEAEASESVSTSSETNFERRPTQPLQVEQPGSPVAVSDDALVQSAKEAWIVAESAMQRARNTANGINASIAILSQTERLSKEFMDELTSKQTEANRELLQAQDIARVAYERFVQTQKDAQSTASQSTDVSSDSSESSSQKKQEEQEDTSLPPAEENGLDQTAKLQAVRLYSEW